MRGKKWVVLVMLVVLSIVVVACAGVASWNPGAKDSRGKVAGDYKYRVTFTPPGGGRYVYYYTDESPAVEEGDRVVLNYRMESIDAVTIGVEVRIPVNNSIVTKQHED